MWPINKLSKIILRDESLSLRKSKSLLLMALMDFHGKDGKIFPSQKKLAKKCKCSLSTIKRHLKELEESKYLSISRNLYKTSDYKINLPVLIDSLNLPQPELEKLLKTTQTSTEFYTYKNNGLDTEKNYAQGVKMTYPPGSEWTTNNIILNINNNIEREDASLSLSDFSPIEYLDDLDKYELMNPMEVLERELNAVVEKTSEPLVDNDKKVISSRVGGVEKVLRRTFPVRKFTSKIKELNNKSYPEKSKISIAFLPTDDHKQLALRRGVDINSTLEKFIDWHVANDSEKTNWDKQFEIWIKGERKTDFNKNSQAVIHNYEAARLKEDEEARKKQTEKLVVKVSTPEAIAKRDAAIAAIRNRYRLTPKGSPSWEAVSRINSEKALGCGVGR